MPGQIRAVVPALTLALGLLVGVSGCAGSPPPAPPAAHEVVEALAPTPTPSVVPYDDSYDPGRYGTGDPQVDMGLISGDFVVGIQAVRAYAPSAYPDIYTGVGGGVPGDPDVLRIILTSLDPAVEADLLAVSGMPAEKVRFEQGQVSEKDGLALQDRIMDDVISGSLGALPVGAFGPAPDGVVEIQLVGHDPAEIQHLWDRYGPDIRIVVDATIAVGADAQACAAASTDPGFLGC